MADPSELQGMWPPVAGVSLWTARAPVLLLSGFLGLVNLRAGEAQAEQQLWPVGPTQWTA